MYIGYLVSVAITFIFIQKESYVEEKDLSEMKNIL